MEQNILPNTMQIQDLPAEIRVRIFKRLNCRERIRLESVSPTWRAMALDTWNDQHILRFSLANPQNELPPLLEAVIRRCAPFLDEFHLLGDFAFDIQMSFGRIFSQLTNPFGRLAHLHITGQLDSWHLRTIQRHLAPQLLSLAVVMIPEILDDFKNDFQQLLANCNKLENLQIATFYYYRPNVLGRIGQVGQGSQQSSSELTSCCSCMPSTLKYLLIDETHWCGDPLLRVNALLSLLAHCSHLRYMPILINSIDNAPVLQLIEEKNPREFDKIISLQFPFFIAKSYSFPYIQKRQEFRNLKALHVDFQIEPEKIYQIAKCCPQLEHLGICLSGSGENHIMEIQDLVALHQFQQLSSLEISVEFGHYNDFQFRHYDDFHEMFCPGGERADKAFLGILTKLDQIHALRSLDFKALSGWDNYPSLSTDYLLQMSNQLKHLETFSCGFYLRNLDLDHMTGIGEFCEQLEQIFVSQKGANKKSFKFSLFNAYEWDFDSYGSGEKKNLLVEWQKESGTKRSKMNWHCMRLTGPELGHRNYDFEPARSIVLNELITSHFGQRISSMLFDSFGMMEEEY